MVKLKEGSFVVHSFTLSQLISTVLGVEEADDSNVYVVSQCWMSRIVRKFGSRQLRSQNGTSHGKTYSNILTLNGQNQRLTNRWVMEGNGTQQYADVFKGTVDSLQSYGNALLQAFNG